MIVTRRAMLVGALAIGCSRKGVSSVVDAGARVVSLSPSTTEAVAAVGALASLVGRSRYCDFPPEVTVLPEVGGYVDPNLEAIIALSPTLVVGARGPAGSSVVDKLTARNIATYFPQTESLAEIDEMLTGIGTRLGRADEAAKVCARIGDRTNAIDAATRPLARVKVALLFGVQPIVAAGTKTFAHDMLGRANAENVVAGAGYPALDLEALAALDPDVILNAAARVGHGGESIPKDALGWRSLRAIKTDRVVDLTDESVLRQGPRVAEGLATLARALHPSVAL
jgi:iron complex transport system substrate-binding protein